MRRPPNDQDSSGPRGCDDLAGELALFADGELGEAERVAVELHLVDCRRCREAVDFALSFRSSLQRHAAASTASPGAPAALRGRLTAALDAEPAPDRIPSKVRRFFSPIPAAAAGATAVGVTAWLWFGVPANDVVRDIVARHAKGLPMEIQSDDPQSLERWLSDKVEFRVRVPCPRAGHLNLLGARLSHVKDHSAVYLLYGSRAAPNKRVGLLVYEDGKAPPGLGEPRKIADHEVYTANSAGYNVAMWKKNEVVYSLVSDGEEDVLELVRAAH